MKLLNSPGLTRIVPVVIASLGLISASASALEKAEIYLIGKSFSHGKTLKLDSKGQKIAKSKLYTYSVKGTVGGTGKLAGFLPAGTPIGKFLDMIAEDSSKLLSGSKENPSGALPFTIIDNEKISGVENIPGLGKVSVSVILKVEILQSGVVELNLSNVKIQRTGKPIPGSVKFGRGSTVSVTTAPIVQFRASGQNVDEDVADGKVFVTVSRSGYQKTAAKVAYSTSDDNAVTGVDYTGVTSGIVEFASGQLTQTIPIDITNNLLVDGYRKFKITLADIPESGTVLGGRTTTTVGILNDD